ncbi:MAG: heavy metal sensor histidine kinase, partial [Burkholderiales bacterium]|nr:heavy metal sensor histidine kinase [Burkholderiales bacterium]
MNGSPPRFRSSLTARLVTLFCCGSALIMIAVTASLYHTLRLQVEALDAEVIEGKTRTVEHLLDDAGTPDRLDEVRERLSDLLMSHPDLSVGLRVGDDWIVAPLPEVAAAAVRLGSGVPPATADLATVEGLDRTWWLKRVQHPWTGASTAPVEVVVALDVSDSERLLRGEAVTASLVGLFGSLLSGALAFFVARRGLAPIARVAERAEQITVQGLGTALAVEDAPTEIRGLAESINHMLARLSDSFRALEQFSADIAHELRTPIHNLLLQTQVTLSRPRAAEEYREALLSNLEELQRLDRMVSDMLFLARADRGVLTVADDTVDLAQEATNVAEYFEPAASERSQEIVIHGHSVARGDRLMIRRAITNLLSNAVRHAPPGDRIVVRARSAADAAVFEVINSCPAPIRSDELPRLFTRFARGNEPREDDRDGAGLGLAIVDSIMRLHGGVAQAESGSFGIRFTLRFPS